MKLTIIIIQVMELSEVVLENLQYLPLQLHSPFQLVVLEGRIVNFHLHTKNQFKLFTVASRISDITNSLCDMILSHFRAVSWLNIHFKLIVIYEDLVHAMTL